MGDTMKIIGLKVQNLRNIELVEVKFDGHGFVEITGKNGSGKTTLLDALFTALIGTKYYGRGFSTWRVIRKGEDKALIKVTIGNADRQIEVKRSITKKTGEDGKVSSGGSLVITDTSGEKLGQDFLDKILSQFTVDPLRFGDLEAKAQAEIIKKLAGLDTEKLEQERAAAYEKRREANVSVRNMKAKVVEELDPVDEVNVSELIAERKAIEARNEERRSKAAEQRHAVMWVEGLVQKRDDLAGRIEKMRAQIDDMIEELTDLERSIVDGDKAMKEFDEPDEEESAEVVDTAIANASEINAKAERYKAWKAQKAELATYEKEQAKWQKAIDTVDDTIRRALSSSKLPFKNLELDESDGVLIGGVPFSHLSTAEQIRVSARIGMELAPELRVIRIPDGSLLDEESYAVVRELAKKHDYQVLVESVGEKGGENQIVLRAGHVIAAYERVETPKQKADRMGDEL